MRRYWWILALVLVCAGCGDTDKNADRPNEVRFALAPGLAAECSIYYNEDEIEAWFEECPEEERIPLRHPMSGEVTALKLQGLPAYIAVEDVEAVVRRVMMEDDVLHQVLDSRSTYTINDTGVESVTEEGSHFVTRYRDSDKVWRDPIGEAR